MECKIDSHFIVIHLQLIMWKSKCLLGCQFISIYIENTTPKYVKFKLKGISNFLLYIIMCCTREEWMINRLYIKTMTDTRFVWFVKFCWIKFKCRQNKTIKMHSLINYDKSRLDARAVTLKTAQHACVMLYRFVEVITFAIVISIS